VNGKTLLGIVRCKRQLGAAGATTAAILGLTGASIKSIGIVAQVLGAGRCPAL
jgi:hypothetical protein